MISLQEKLKQLFSKKEVLPAFHGNSICPYCFVEIKDDEYHFRETKGDDDIIDELLTRFYREIMNDDDYPEQMERNFVKVGDEGVTSIRRKDGSLWKLKIESENRELSQLLCPHCHNNLPSEFGTKPLKIIAFYGNTSSGKTVYLTQLLGDAFNNVQKEYDAGLFDLFTQDSRLRNNREKLQKEVLSATTMSEYSKPFIREIIFNNTGEEVIFSIFDIPGESHENSDYMQDMRSRQFQYCDAIMVFMHPDNHSVHDGDENPKGIEDNYAITQSFRSYLREYATNKKIAIVLSKSDRLIENSDLADTIVFEEFSKLNLEDVGLINEKVSSFFEKTQPTVYRNLEAILKESDYKFFAVSSLGENPDNNQINHVLQPIRVAEPFLWILNECGVKSLKGN